MTETIAQVALIIGLLGALYIVIKKIPILAELPENLSSFQTEGLLSQAKKIAGKITFLKSFSVNIYLQKVLSKTKILTMRFEGKISSWLQDLRAKAQKRQNTTDNYWEELKKSTLQKVIKRRKPKEQSAVEVIAQEENSHIEEAKNNL